VQKFVADENKTRQLPRLASLATPLHSGEGHCNHQPLRHRVHVLQAKNTNSENCVLGFGHGAKLGIKFLVTYFQLTFESGGGGQQVNLGDVPPAPT